MDDELTDELLRWKIPKERRRELDRYAEWRGFKATTQEWEKAVRILSRKQVSEEPTEEERLEYDQWQDTEREMMGYAPEPGNGDELFYLERARRRLVEEARQKQADEEEDRTSDVLTKDTGTKRSRRKGRKGGRPPTLTEAELREACHAVHERRRYTGFNSAVLGVLTACNRVCKDKKLLIGGEALREWYLRRYPKERRKK